MKNYSNLKLYILNFWNKNQRGTQYGDYQYIMSLLSDIHDSFNDRKLLVFPKDVGRCNGEISATRLFQ